MDDYRVLLDWESIDTLKRSRGTHRRKLLAFIESLATNPFQVGEYQRTRGSREVEVKVLGKYAVYYWADHAVQEIKVIDIIRSIH